MTDDFAFGGARAMVALHETHLRRFYETWKEAERRRLPWPVIDDPDYASPEALLVHVVRCAAGYLAWTCRNLGLPMPDLGARPDPETIREQAEARLETILAAWRTALVSVTQEQADERSFPAPWGPMYCVDAMLEHAVMHPIRHTHQLERWLAEGSAS